MLGECTQKRRGRISTTTQWVDERNSTTQLRWSKRQHHTQSEQTFLPRGGIRCAHALLLYNWSRSVGHRVVPSMLVLADPTLRAVDNAAIPLSDAGDRFSASAAAVGDDTRGAFPLSQRSEDCGWETHCWSNFR